MKTEFFLCYNDTISGFGHIFRNADMHGDHSSEKGKCMKLVGVYVTVISFL